MPQKKVRSLLKKPSIRNARKERLLVGYFGKVETLVVKDIVTMEDIESKDDALESLSSHYLIFPCISTCERYPILCRSKSILSTSMDFDLYNCSGCQIQSDTGEVGNAIFLTSSFGITAKHVVPCTNDDVFFNFPLKSLKSECLGFVQASFTAKDDLTLVRLPQNLPGFRSVMVPEVPPEIRKETNHKQPNCIVFAYVPPEFSELYQISVFRLNGSKLEKEMDQEVIDILSDDVRLIVKKYMSNHNQMIATYGFTKDEWKNELNPNIQCHSCSTLNGFSGSAIRIVKDEYIQIEESETPKRSPNMHLQFTNTPSVPIFHGIHLSNSSSGINQFIRTDSLSFILLYSLSIYNTNVGNRDIIIFPTLEHAKASLKYLLEVSSLEKLQDTSSETVKTVINALSSAIDIVKNSISIFERCHGLIVKV